MTESDLKRIEERAAKASPVQAEPRSHLRLVNLWMGDYDFGTLECAYEGIELDQIRAIGELFEHARPDILALVAEVRRLRREAAEMWDRTRESSGFNPGKCPCEHCTAPNPYRDGVES